MKIRKLLLTLSNWIIAGIVIYIVFLFFKQWSVGRQEAALGIDPFWGKAWGYGIEIIIWIYIVIPFIFLSVVLKFFHFRSGTKFQKITFWGISMLGMSVSIWIFFAIFGTHFFKNILDYLK